MSKHEEPLLAKGLGAGRVGGSGGGKGGGSGSRFADKLKYYLTGIAIGCVIAGFLFYGRWLMIRARQQQQQTQQQAQPGGGGGGKP